MSEPDDAAVLTPDELSLLHRAVAEAAAARDAGNHPFGAVLGGPDGELLLTAQNTVVTESDVTDHAESNLVRLAGRRYGRTGLRASTLFSSAEPCAMCAGAIYWSGIGRVVFAVAEDVLRGFVGDDPEPTLSLPCRTVFAAGERPVTVIGPVPVAGADAVHAGFWRG